MSWNLLQLSDPAQAPFLPDTVEASDREAPGKGHKETLERLPISWNHVIEKESLNVNNWSRSLSKKSVLS
jgi:hypothetical protein